MACQKPIVILKDQSFDINEVPVAWKEFEKLLTGPRTIVCDPQQLTQFASQLKDIRTNSNKNTMHFYKFEDSGKI